MLCFCDIAKTLIMRSQVINISHWWEKNKERTINWWKTAANVQIANFPNIELFFEQLIIKKGLSIAIDI